MNTNTTQRTPTPYPQLDDMWGVMTDVELRLAEKTRRLQQAEELLREAHGQLEGAEITLRRCTAYAPNDEKTDLIMRTVKKAVAVQDRIAAFLNSKTP